jgi:hypothetical protein
VAVIPQLMEGSTLLFCEHELLSASSLSGMCTRVYFSISAVKCLRNFPGPLQDGATWGQHSVHVLVYRSRNPKAMGWRCQCPDPRA